MADNPHRTELPPALPWPEHIADRVRGSCERLGRLLDQNAPAALIAYEAAHLFQRLALRYGADIYTALGKLTIEHTLAAWDRCHRHPEHDRTTGDCPACESEENEAEVSAP